MSERSHEIADAITHAKTRFATEPAVWKARIERFLESQAGGRESIVVEDLRLPPASGGASSGTILFRVRYSSSERKDDMVLRFDPGKSHAHEYDMVGQYRILRALESTRVPAPHTIGVDETGTYFGVPGFLMRLIEGTPLPTTYVSTGPLFDATPAGRRHMIEDVLGALAEIHRVDWRSLGLDRVARQGKGRTAFEKDLDWYRAAMRWGVPELEAQLDPVMQWLLDHQFEPQRLTLCHGDSSLPNYMFKDGRLVGVLDWEFAFIGAPELDIAFQSVAHEVLALGQEPLAGLPSITERMAIYETKSGQKLDSWDYYFTFACMKAFIHMALTYRDAPPELLAARERYLGLPARMMYESWDAARR